MDQRLALVGDYYYNPEGSPTPVPTPSVIIRVNKNNIEKAKTLVNKLQASGGKYSNLISSNYCGTSEVFNFLK